MYHGDLEHSRNYSTRTWLLFLLAVVIGVTLCSTSVYAALEIRCYQDTRQSLPVYPGAEVLQEEYSFIRAWGIGETQQILYSPDSTNTVRAWYIDYFFENDLSTPDGFQGVANTQWFVTDASDGEGAQIVLYADCSSDMELW